MKVSHLLSGYRLVLEKMNWDAAKEHCQDLGGRLADIKSQEEEEFVERFVSGVNNQLWLGATDRESEGTFLWQDGTSISDAYVKWGKNQPDNFKDMEYSMVLSDFETGSK
ncbi:C-type lectin lectoxin-Lio3-like [Mercenaria mercenaria]|uniref:C-type lectin lectoxin-Lio3-like n=1 Tax=Mercenaria mercenaria TaxID=6596 RepID=UPI00234F952A|nr:C-type lectin lectoxin-Lio3-like [Mercenaria mercenaria]